jgi:uncharacterized delta-60 repeat protein
MTRSIATLIILLLATTRAGAAAGDVDTGFGAAGVVALAGGRPLGRATDVKVLADGRILVVSGERVYRLLPTGALDLTFGRRGTASRLQVRARRLAVQADGKIVVTGAHRINSPLLVGRLTENGRLDRAFGRGGTVRIDERRSDESWQAVLDGQGRVVVLFLDTPEGGLVRLLPDGARDASFGTNGVVVEPQFTGNGFTALAVQPDGKILAAVGGSLVRYVDDGRRDTTFGYLNSGTTALGKPGEAHRSAALFPLADGTIVTVGARIWFPYVSFTGVSVGRLLPDGSADPSFGTAGYVSLPVGEYSLGTGGALLADGRIVAVGYGEPDEEPAAAPDLDYFVARFLPDGTPDASFGSGGILSADLLGPVQGHYMSDQATAVAIQPDGAIVAAVTVFDPLLVDARRDPVWGYATRRLGE